MTKWEMFYCDSDKDEDLINQISLDIENKRYILDVDAEMWITDDVDENGEPYSRSYYVSKALFNFMLDVLKEKGFKRAAWKEINEKDCEE